MIFRHTLEVKVHVYGQISGQKYEFPAFTGKITHAHTVCTRPFLLLLKGPGYEANRILYSYVALVPTPSCIWQYKFVHKFASTLDTSYLIYMALCPWKQFTFLWLLGNYDETYGVIT